jgi:alpha-L-arabinofuranosidase
MNRSHISLRRCALPRVIALAVLVFSVLAAGAQTATNIAITSTVQASSVKRLGVNLGDQSFYDSAQMMKNLIFQNPGFEPEKYRSIMYCGAVSANTCTDDNEYSPQPTGFWTGATYLVMTGNSKGKTGKITASTKNPSSCSTCGQIMQFDQSINAAIGDYFVVTQNFPGSGDAGWWDSTSGGGTITSETNDLSSETPGTQALALNATASGASAAVTSYFDNEDGISFIQMNGAFAITFRAKGIGGNNQLSINMQRTNTSGNLVYVNKTITLTNAWADYTVTFNAAETGSATGTAQLVFSVKGASAELDDVSLAQTNSSASNPTAFRDDVVNTLLELQPGTIRMMAGDGALGADLIDQIQVPFARYREGWSTGLTSNDVIPYGIHEFLQLCETVGADPWITIPTATTKAEMTAFIEYLTGTGSDQYSSLRISRGQTAPWTSVFNKIHLELGNETWNGSFRGESMTYNGYPYVANDIFGAARATSGYVASKFDLVLDGLAASPGYNAVLLARSTQHDSIDGAPYLLFSANNEAQSTMFGALFAEPEIFDSAGGEMYQNVVTAKAAPTPTYVSVYETNLSPIEGTITETQLNNLTPSIGAGLAHTEHMLQMMRAGVVYQNAFSLPQYAFQRTDGLVVKLWGIVRDMGTTNRRRPQFHTMAMANAVIGGNMLATTQTGANPTWNQPLSSDNVVLNGAHYLQSFAFQNGSNVSVVVFNLSQTTALPVTFSGANAPSGSVQMTQITSSNITDNNETSQVVAPTTQTLSGFNPATGLTLPPFSMTVLTVAGSSTQAPTFTPAGGTYTSSQTVTMSDGTSGAKIYYTTDGSTPTTSSTVYSAPISVSKSETLQAIAVSSGLSNSAVTSGSYVISTSSATAATPVFSVAGGTYSSAQTVTITDATSGAAIYYTTNGTTPTTSSTKYSGAITVSASETLEAIAVATNYTNSAVASATYTIGQTAARPGFSLAGGTYASAQKLTMTDSTPGAAIYYTTNGATPTTASTKYTSTITVSTTETVKAIAVASGYANSGLAQATYTIGGGTATPVVSVAAGTYSAPFTETITDASSGSVIYYTINGGAAIKYSGPFTVSNSTTMTVYAYANYVKSAVLTETYVISTTAPIFSVAAGTYSTAQKVSIAGKTSGSVVYYTTNGTTPTTSSTKYTGAITVSGTETLKAIAVAPGMGPSTVTSAAYTIANGTAATPSLSVATGTYTAAQKVTMATSTSGAAIFYTTNGTTPTASSTKYTGPITVSESQTVRAIAAKTGMKASTVAVATYKIETTAPTFSEKSGTYTTELTVTLKSATPGATIYYTTNGEPPTTSSKRYTEPFKVSSTTTVKAIADTSKTEPSKVATVVYAIQLPASAPTFSLKAGTYTGPQTLTMKTATSGAVIYYTVNGTKPTTSSTRYTGPIHVSVSKTVSAIAKSSTTTASAVAKEVYTVKAPGVL